MEQSTITSKGQTTIPVEIRQKLGLKPGDRLLYVEEDGKVVLRVYPGVSAVAGMLKDKIAVRSTGDFDAERRVAHEAWARQAMDLPEPEGPK